MLNCTVIAQRLKFDFCGFVIYVSLALSSVTVNCCRNLVLENLQYRFSFILLE